MPVKGSDTANTLIATPKRVDVRSDGKVIPNGVALWIVGSSIAKGELYGWLRQPRPENGETAPTGWVHWPEYDEEHFKQLTAEQIITRVVRGQRRSQWEKTRERNEALDLHVYNRVAAAQIGIDRWEPKRWEALRAELTIRVESTSNASPTTAHAKIKPRKSSYW
jgi:phage terminase large subunit GpA-like protein